MATEPSFAQSQQIDALPTPNLPLLRKVLDHIDAHPEEYRQRTYRTASSCGTAYCIAGHAAVMSGAVFTDPTTVLTPDEREMPVSDYAQEALGITLTEAFCHSPEAGLYGLFAGDSTREHVQLAAEKIAARAGERL